MGKSIPRAKGQIKQAACSGRGNSKLEREDTADEMKGKVKGAAENVQEAKYAVKK